MKLTCACCDKEIVEVPDSLGLGNQAYQVRKAGGIPKNPILLTGISQWLWFCTKECAQLYYDTVLQVDPERRAQVKVELDAIRAKIPEWSRQTAAAVISFKSKLEHLNIEIRKRQ